MTRPDPRRAAPSGHSPVRRAILFLAGLVLALAGAGLIWTGLFAGDEPAPLPDTTWTVATPTPKPTPTGTVDSDDGPVTPDTMGPNRLLIPSLSVYAKVNDEPVADGGLVLPIHTQVARYSGGGSVTGTTGTLLIAGHVSSYGQPGALKWLSKLQPGDWFYVTDVDGNRASFVVDGMDVRLKQDLPQDLFSADGERRAVLVTCGGKVVTRDDGSRHYDSNTIVTGTQVTTSATPDPTTTANQ